MEIVGCPEPGCFVPAEVIDRWEFPSTDGPIEHTRTGCLNFHFRTVVVDAAELTSRLRSRQVGRA